MKKIVFDDIHTQDKQQRLKAMMTQVATETRLLPNDNTKLNACPVCDGKHIEFYLQQYGYDLDCCRSCQHLFTNPMPSAAQLDHYYNSDMKAFENDFFSASFEQRIPIFSYRIQRIGDYLQRGRLLDVGSAIGIFVEAMARSDSALSLECCEPSRDACQRLSQRYPAMPLHACWLQDMDADASYDAISLWDTLEHIVDIEAFGATVRRLLKPGGYWFFSTPNTRSLEWSVAGKQHVQLLPPGHVNLFNKDNIQLYLQRLGFHWVSLETPNGSLDVSYVQKILGSNPEIDANMGGFIKHNIQSSSFADTLAELLVKERLGGNMFVVAHRPIHGG